MCIRDRRHSIQSNQSVSSNQLSRYSCFLSPNRIDHAKVNLFYLILKMPEFFNIKNLAKLGLIHVNCEWLFYRAKNTALQAFIYLARRAALTKTCIIMPNKRYFFGMGFIGIIELLGTTTSLLFFGFFTSLLLLIWPLAMRIDVYKRQIFHHRSMMRLAILFKENPHG